jgi:5-methyltetrahydrofolate--homocysteine methyltransferase
MGLKKLIGKEILVFDGAMGTTLQNLGLPGGRLSEMFNFEEPEAVKNIYKEYIRAGSRILTTNTFSSNSQKLEREGLSVDQSVKKAVELAKQAIKEYTEEAQNLQISKDGHSTQDNKEFQSKDNMAEYKVENILVAHDMGPIGQMMKPVGELDFDQAYDLFKEQVIAGRDAGADFHFFETFSDITELRAGIIATKENSELPILCSVTFNDDGRMLLGTDPETAVYMLEDLGVEAMGINCSLGPKEIIPLITRMLKVSKIPILVQPNAGMPREEDGQTYYDVSPGGFADSMLEMLEAGVALVGGCCGTTPEHIKALADRIQKYNDDNINNFPGISQEFYDEKLESAQPTACTPNKSVEYGKSTIIIGERINPTGKKNLKEALLKKDYDFVKEEALSQYNAGAHMLELNVGMEDLDSKAAMTDLSYEIAETVNIPLIIDSSDPEVIEAGVRKYGGKAIINSVNGEQKSMDKVLPIVEKYGTAVIALTLDENGIPKTTEERLNILDKIIKEAEEYGITKDRLIVDTLALTVSTDPIAAKKTLKAIEIISEKYKMNTVLGASNISFGLPNRDLVNRTFLSMAILSGITSVITDPTKVDYMDEIRAAEVLAGRDEFAENYICYNKEAGDREKKNLNSSANKNQRDDSKDKSESVQKKDTSLRTIILEGREELAPQATEELLREKAPMDIISEIVIPSLTKIGDDYESGETFLPQMLKSAETVKKTFDILRPIIAGEGKSISKGKIAVATVEGDIHDIGKNIVKTVLENYGYEIIDLGKDVSTDMIIDTIKKDDIKLVGLSALMTTTMINMKPTIDTIAREGLDCKVAVGGAVLTQEYAEKIGADFYCETAMDTVRAADTVFK